MPRTPPEAAPAIAAWLGRALGAGGAVIERLELLGGGAIQENWAFDLVTRDGARHALVLRTDAPSRIALSWDRAQEYRVLEAAWRAGVTVPEPVGLCLDQAVLGRPFQVMRQVAGEARGARLVRDPLVLAGGEALAFRLGRELATLHRLTPPVAGLGFMEVPEGSPALARVGAYRAHLDALEAAEPVLEWALGWLERHAPPPGRVCLLHGDFRTGNYLVRDGELAAVLDWEFAGYGDPLEDLGWALMRAWRFGNDARHCGGIGSRAAFLAGYEATAGHPVARGLIPYWEVMGTLRWAVIALMQACRHKTGAEASLELLLTGHLVPVLERDLLDYLAAAGGAS